MFCAISHAESSIRAKFQYIQPNLLQNNPPFAFIQSLTQNKRK